MFLTAYKHISHFIAKMLKVIKKKNKYASADALSPSITKTKENALFEVSSK